MPSKKSREESREKKGKEEREEEHILEEDDEEEAIDEPELYLAENAEEKLDEALMILSQGAPAIISQETRPDYEPFPTETHLKNKVKYTPGDRTFEHNDTLILR